MSKPGEVLDVPSLGVRAEVVQTAEETGGARYVFDVVGRARGFITQPHRHTRQSERHEVLEGSMVLVLGRERHLLRAGDAMVVPPGTSHRQLPGPDGGSGRVRVTMEPAGDTDGFLHRLEEMDRTGGLMRSGYPRPLAGAALVCDFGDEGHASFPPLRVQQALARKLLSAASREYVFVDEWDVAAPREAVFDALADARSYPEWWRPVYIGVESDGETRVGSVSRQHFKGRLPYHLHTRSTVTRLEAPHVVEADVEGDLRGHGRWTLTETAGGRTHVRFDWRVFADRPLLRALTPVLRPALRWNHAWAIARAREGLEPYAQRTAAAAARQPAIA